MSNCILQGTRAGVGYRLFSQVGRGGRRGIGLKRSSPQHRLTLILHFSLCGGRWFICLVQSCSCTPNNFTEEQVFNQCSVHWLWLRHLSSKCYMLNIECRFKGRYCWRQKYRSVEFMILAFTRWLYLLCVCVTVSSRFVVFVVGLSNYATHGARRNGAEYEEHQF